ncbi:MAG: DUF3131 domain-containing protein, partial [Phycisphaerales bacterium]|nr:DUF3131 domain-containing protein [Phycisphaerales bacterium]
TAGASPLKPAAEWVIAADPATPKPPFEFSREDEEFLEKIQRATWGFLWEACDPDTGMVVDRTSVKFASIAGVGFQLASIPAAVERKYITREEGQQRALTILRALAANPDNRKHGIFYHFLTGPTAKPVDMDVVSTIDTALLFAGALVAGSYFQGEVDAIATRLVDEADWAAFKLEKPPKGEEYLKGFLALGWKPTDPKKPTGEGRFTPHAWFDAGDEQRLIYFVSQLSPKAEHRVDPADYYRLRRALGSYADSGPHSWFPWSGALFTNVFAHLSIDYGRMGPDDPAALGVERRAKIDWWENSRRAVQLHRAKALAAQGKVPTLGPNAWGLTANDAASGYQVPGVFPDPIRFADTVPEVDVSTFRPKDDLGGGNVAPYGAGTAIMFQPGPAVAALRHYYGLKDKAGKPLVWREPQTNLEFGFRDSFNLGTGWVAPDYVSIDQGPLFLAIENARTGLTWRLFHAHPRVQDAMGRLGLRLANAGRAGPR